MRTSVLSLLFFVTSSLLFFRPVAAQEASDHNGVQCKVYTIVAREKKAPLPKELLQFKDILSKIPFKAYGSFQLRQNVDIVLGQKPARTRLAHELFMTTKLIERILESRNKVRYRIQLQIQREQGTKNIKTTVLHNMTIKLAAEKPMFIAGPKENEDTLVIGLICN